MSETGHFLRVDEQFNLPGFQNPEGLQRAAGVRYSGSTT